MPPSRKKHNSSSGGAATANNNGPENNNDNVVGAAAAAGGARRGGGGGAGTSSRPMTCSVPTNCLTPDKLIYNEDIGNGDIDVVKIVCNNSHCNQSEYMHLECFEAWEKTVLAYLRSSGRSRPWSGKQKLQNIWTKKAYDVVFKACGCKCGSGHIRKDLNWVPPTKTAPIAIPGAEGGERAEAQAAGGKKKKKKTKEPLPTLAVSAPIPHPNNNHAKHSNLSGGSGIGTSCSLSSGSGSMEKSASVASHAPSLGSLGYGSCDSFDLGSLPNSTSSAISLRPRINSLSSNISTSSSSSSAGGSPPPLDAQFSTMTLANSNLQKNGLAAVQLQQQQLALQQRRRSSNSLNESNVIAERQRLDSFSNNGLFSTREDLRSLRFLPAHKFNRYHIKVMDDHGHDRNLDATRNFIVSTLKKTKIPCVRCIICELQTPVYEKYPLIDGTFFLSPRQHSDFSIETIRGKQYLNAVCVRCLEEYTYRLESKCCGKRWDSSRLGLVLGTCYTYDIFAATPCCPDRLRCLRCHNFVKGGCELSFFSDYNQSYQCPACGLVEFHFVRPVPCIFNRRLADEVR